MKKNFALVFIFLLFSCASTQKQTDAGKMPQNTGEQQMQSQNTETSAADTEKTQNDDKGAPIYRYSENDRTKPFKKVGAGTGATTAEIADNAKNISAKKNKVSKPDAASEKAPVDKDKGKTPGAATTPSPRTGDKTSKPDAASEKAPADKDKGKTPGATTTPPQRTADKTSKPDAASEKTPADKDKSKTPGAATTPSPRTGDKTSKPDTASEKAPADKDKSKTPGTATTPSPRTGDKTSKPDAASEKTPADKNKGKTPGTTTTPPQRTADKVSKPDAASEKTSAGKDKSKTQRTVTTPNKDGAAIGKADSAANKNEKKSMNADQVEVPEMPFENAPSDENVYTPDYFSEFPNSDGAANETVMPSRSVTMNQKQRLKVRYPGEKWVFLGEQTSQKGLNYEQRKFQNGDTEFTFNAQKPGNYILNFSRYDAYSNSFIKDALEVSVGTSLAHAPATVQAPEYTLPAPLNDNAQKLSPTVKNSQQTAKQQLTPNNKGDLIIPVEEAQPVLAQTDLLEQAKKAIARGDAKSAIKDLKQFLKTSVERLDEAYFYLGQAYEINGSEKNIKEAYRAYKTVTDSFVDSNFWISSDERIRYIKRFFIDIE